VFKVFVSVCVVVCCSRINSARACRTVRSPACNELLTAASFVQPVSSVTAAAVGLDRIARLSFLGRRYGDD
jgi:hypothetical protein